uniref:(northern house mosquito) hypothetical protein n=1 Tax=Culex pipiens TaxID=7175 RepID=A0A8D8BZY0_CULPI
MSREADALERTSPGVGLQGVRQSVCGKAELGGPHEGALGRETVPVRPVWQTAQSEALAGPAHGVQASGAGVRVRAESVGPDAAAVQGSFQHAEAGKKGAEEEGTEA